MYKDKFSLKPLNIFNSNSLCENGIEPLHIINELRPNDSVCTYVTRKVHTLITLITL